MSRVTHFEIHTADSARAMRFYGELFGWKFTRWQGPEEYWLIRTGEPGTPGIDGGLVLRRGAGPIEGQAVNAFISSIQTEALDDVLARMRALGGALALPKMPIPHVGWLAYLKDPDGNLVGVMQPDPAAA
jgi:hypothetical protein